MEWPPRLLSAGMLYLYRCVYTGVLAMNPTLTVRKHPLPHPQGAPANGAKAV